MSGPRFIFAVPGAQRRVMHVERFTASGEPLMEALCGIDLPFNRTINQPWGLARPVCKRCRRVEER